MHKQRGGGVECVEGTSDIRKAVKQMLLQSRDEEKDIVLGKNTMAHEKASNSAYSSEFSTFSVVGFHFLYFSV